MRTSRIYKRNGGSSAGKETKGSKRRVEKDKRRVMIITSKGWNEAKERKECWMEVIRGSEGGKKRW